MRILSACAFLLATATTCSAGDPEDCKGTNPDRMIPACTRLITSPKSGAETKAAAHDQRSWAHNAKGQNDQALDDANQALRLNPSLATAYGNRGWAYAGKGDFDAAIPEYNEALRLNPKLWTVYDLRAWAFVAKGDPDRAIADYGEALRVNPRFYVALNGRGSTYTSVGEYDKAVADFTAALKLKRGLRSSHSLRGWAHMGKGDYDRAIADYNDVVKISPGASAYADRGWIHHLRKEYEAALADYTKAIELAPNFSIAFSNRAETYNAKGLHDRAIADADAAARLDPANKYAYDSRGRALLAKGDANGALADFNRSLSVDPTYLLALIGRAEAALASNDRAAAASDLRAAVALQVFRSYEKQAQAEAASLLSGLKVEPPPVAPQAIAPAPVISPVAGRYALLIGNQTYADKVGPLRNPHNDVARVAMALKSLGFKVTELRDGGLRWIEVAVNRHIGTLRAEGQAAVGLLYYSGHGAAHAETKINYLIPVDVPSAEDEELWHHSVNLNKLVERLREEAPAATHYVVFDACRNELNLTQKGQRALIQKGFAPIAYMPGVLVAYATAPGMTATDGGAGGGPYANAFADEIVKPGIESILVFTRVARHVYRQIGQNPYMSASTMPEIYFAGERTSRTDAKR